MPDINEVITLGVGTPSSIEHFILLGLNGNPTTGTAVQVYGYVYMPTAIGGPVQMIVTMRGAVDMVGAMHGKANML